MAGDRVRNAERDEEGKVLDDVRLGDRHMNVEIDGDTVRVSVTGWTKI
jgi:hypothetical protein